MGKSGGIICRVGGGAVRNVRRIWLMMDIVLRMSEGFF